MEIKVENHRIFVKYEGEDKWVDVSEYEPLTQSVESNYTEYNYISNYPIWDTPSRWCVKPLHLEEEQTVEEVKSQGINIELSAIL